jgi:acetyltransferase
MITLEQIQDLSDDRADLAVLLSNCVENGASIGFVLPLPALEIAEYWDAVQKSLEGGLRVMWVARQEGKVVGSVQLALESRKNGIHRAEVNKLMVCTEARRQGIARMLMVALEAVALERKCSTLFLDTVLGNPVELLYRDLGYQFVGSIPAYATDVHGTLEANAIYCKLI